jgi:predicted transcriptional regulator
MRLRKPAVATGLALWFKAGVTKDDFLREKRAASRTIRVDRGLRKSFGISASQLSRGLHALADAGLIRIAKGGAGRCPIVVIVNIQIPRDGAGHNMT